MHLRKLLKLICPILALLLLTGCSGIKDLASNVIERFKEAASETASANYEANPYKYPHEYAVNTFNEVLELVEAKDSRAIFDKFSEYDKAKFDMMPDIEILVNFLDGKVVEMRHVGASGDYSSVRDGITVSAGYSANTYVTTDKGTLYWFKVGVVTAADDESKLGLDWIYILSCDVQTEYSTEWGNWNERRINGAKEPEPERPEDMEVGVHYFKSQK